MKFWNILNNTDLTVLYQNKALHNSLKRGQCSIAGRIIELD